MTDNATLNSMSGGIKAATREIAYSGETAHAQAMGLVVFSGADDAKTAADVTQASPLPVYEPDVTASATLLLLNDAVSATLNGDGSWSIDLSGFAGHVVTFESQVNSSTPWRAINGALQGVGTLATTATADGTYRGAAAALAGIRARLSTLGTGMVTASLRAGAVSGGVFLMAPIPTGSNTLGAVTGPGAAALALDGTDISSPTAMPAGGVGIRGWLSSIWTKLNGILSVVITSNGLISTNNSSATPLGAGAAFTGTSEDVTEWGEARVSVFADQVGATDGLQMQQSSNNVNWDVIDTFTIPASTGKTFSAALSLKHFRIVNTNGGVAQGVMRLQTKYFKSYNKASSVRPQDGRSNENDFEEVLGYNMGWNGSSWDRLLATLGKLNVIQPDITASGSLTAAGQLVNLALNGQSSATIQITGTWTGTIQFEGTTGGVTFDPINGVFSSSSAPATTATVNGSYRITPGSLASIQARMTSATSVTGAATIAIRASAGAGGTFANQILPTKNTDGTSTQAIKAASTAAVAADQAAVVSLSPNSPTPAGTNVIGKTGIDQTTPGTTNLVALTAETTKVIGTVNQAALTKGTQGATGVTTQPLRDAGRVNVAITCYQAAGIITTEALFAAATFSISRDGATATTGQQLTVTAGKRFRLQSVVVSVKNTAAAAGTSKLVLRYLAAGGTITNTSPILAILDMGTNGTVANAYIAPTEMSLPDGVELIGSSSFGFTSLCGAVTMLHTITANGYEY